MSPAPVRIILAGAGHAHLVALRNLAGMTRDGIALTIVEPEPESLYSGMVPGLIAGHFERGELAIPVAPLATACGATVLRDAVVEVLPGQRSVRLRGGGTLDYDVLSLDVGAISALSSVAGGERHAIPLRPLSGFLSALGDLERRLPGPLDPPLAVVGAGAAGVEVVLALHHRFNSAAPAGARVPLALVADRTILDGFPGSVVRRFERLLAERGITVHAGTGVTEVGADSLRLADGRSIPVTAAIWAGHAAPHPWLSRSVLETDEAGFIRVDRTLRATGHESIFVVGDAASFDVRPLPKAGVHAVRQGEMLARSLLASARGDAPPPYEAQRAMLAILTTGGRQAVATRNGLSVAGHWVWRWKRFIDKRFVEGLKSVGRS
jgi:selenide,water dikinase